MSSRNNSDELEVSPEHFFKALTEESYQEIIVAGHDAKLHSDKSVCQYRQGNAKLVMAMAASARISHASSARTEWNSNQHQLVSCLPHPVLGKSTDHFFPVSKDVGCGTASTMRNLRSETVKLNVATNSMSGWWCGACGQVGMTG